MRIEFLFRSSFPAHMADVNCDFVHRLDDIFIRDLLLFIRSYHVWEMGAEMSSSISIGGKDPCRDHFDVQGNRVGNVLSIVDVVFDLEEDHVRLLWSRTVWMDLPVREFLRQLVNRRLLRILLSSNGTSMAILVEFSSIASSILQSIAVLRHRRRLSRSNRWFVSTSVPSDSSSDQHRSVILPSKCLSFSSSSADSLVVLPVLLRVRCVSALGSWIVVSRCASSGVEHVLPTLFTSRSFHSESTLSHGILLEDLGWTVRQCLSRGEMFLRQMSTQTRQTNTTRIRRNRPAGLFTSVRLSILDSIEMSMTEKNIFSSVIRRKILLFEWRFVFSRLIFIERFSWRFGQSSRKYFLLN